MKVIGLTGGIASGKTTISQLFSQLGVPVIDLDVIARQVVEPGQPALQAVIDEFGEEILTAEGRLDRQRLREMIFDQAEKRQLLESILHPVIWHNARQQLASLTSPYCLLVIPLLADKASPVPLDRILVVDIPKDEQVRRLVQRDQISARQAEKILRAQTSRQARLALADDVIDNYGDISAAEKQVKQLHQAYLAMSGQ